MILKKMTETYVLGYPHLSKMFEVHCDAFRIDIGGVLSQKRHRVVYFSEKLNEVKKKYSNYEKELYIVV